MKKKFRLISHSFFVTAIFLSVSSLCTAQGLTALEIMQKVNARDDGDNSSCDRTMVLIDKNNHKRSRTMKSFSKDKGEDILKLMFFTSPSDIRDTGFLTWDYHGGERDDDQWLFLPALRKVKRIASSDKSSAFMGSDFSYSDMTKRVVKEWKYTLLKTIKVRKKDCWLIEAIPANDAVQDRYGYKKSLLFIRQDIFMLCRAVHWLDQGNKIKYVDTPGIRQIEGIWTAVELNAKTTRNGKVLHRTVFCSENMKYGQGLEESMFTTRQLEKGI